MSGSKGEAVNEGGCERTITVDRERAIGRERRLADVIVRVPIRQLRLDRRQQEERDRQRQVERDDGRVS